VAAEISGVPTGNFWGAKKPAWGRKKLVFFCVFEVPVGATVL
jgi:hypothetical protein